MEEVATTILSGHHCLLGEGCTYDPATDAAWWFDILERTLFRADLASGAVTSHALPVMASVLAFIDDQRQLLATGDCSRTMNPAACAAQSCTTCAIALARPPRSRKSATPERSRSIGVIEHPL